MKTKLIVLLSLFGFVTFSAKVTGIEKKDTLPIRFTENLGQVTDQNYKLRTDIFFSGISESMAFHLRNNGISYQINKTISWIEVSDPKTKEKIKVADKISAYRLDINWVGINAEIKIIKGEAFGDYANYYSASCPNGVSNVKSYKSITYKNLYDNIDLQYYEKNGTLKYDYIVMPGSDYKKIKLYIDGANKITLQKNGSINFETPYGNINEAAPVVFQNNKLLPAKWVLSENILSFSIDNYDSKLPMVIDPAVRMWGTFYGGGSGSDRLTSMKTDASGNVYLSGFTNSSVSSAIATSGAHQSIYGGGQGDGLLVKFNSSGVRQWATFYGDAGNDWANSCALDNTGNIFLVGHTNSLAGISTPGCHQANLFGVWADGFIVKFNNNGIRQWGTYYGEYQTDIIHDCATDLSGNIYIVGEASPYASPNTISTNGSHQSAGSGGITDGFLVKFNTNGVRQWGTYYGATVNDVINSCVFDGSSYIYLAGTTSSPTSTLIATGTSHQPTYGGGNDAFIAKFDLNGVRQWGSYYGDAGNEEGFACEIDNAGKFYLVGNTSSSLSAIATLGSHQVNYGGGALDAYIAEFNTSGVRQWGSYYGGIGDDEFYGCKADLTGNIYIAGYTNTSAANVISTVGGHQYFYAGGLTDAFLVKLNSAGVRQWGTYYGAYNDDYGYCTAIDNIGNFYLAGQSNSNILNEIATPGSHQPVLGSPGTPDGFLVKFKECPLVTSSLIAQTNLLCYGANDGSATITANGDPSYTYNWIPTGGNNSSASSLTAQTYTCMITGLCGGVSNQTIIITQPPIISNTLTTASTTVCQNTSVTFSVNASGGTGALTYSWSTGSTTSLSTITASNNTTFSVFITDVNNCSINNAIGLTVKPAPILNIVTSDSAICIGESAFLTMYGASSYTWNTGSTSNGYYITPTITTSYTLIGNGLNGCKNSKTYIQIVDPCLILKENKFENFDINIYPNPVQDLLQIKLSGAENDLIKIEIVNNLAQLVRQEELIFKNGKAIINTSDIANGVYLLKLFDSAQSDRKGAVSKRIVIAR